MDNNTQPESVTLESELNEFSPQNSGSFNRFLYKEPVRVGEASAVDQAIGNRTYKSGVENPNNYSFERTVEFPQPSIAGIGVVTAAGAKDTSRYFFSQNWTVSKTGAGSYTITHNIGDSKYNVQVAPVNTAAFTANISAYNLNNFQVKTFNAAGAATDSSFTFVVFIIP